jgi:L-amino acid N-acyltransferase YncA
MTIRPAQAADAAEIAAIYNEGIESRQATFVTRRHTAADVARWLEAPGPQLVAERDGQVIAFAVVGDYSPVPAYHGVGEFAIYVAGSARGQGVGRELLEALVAASEGAGRFKLLEALCEASEEAGRFKLLGKLFADNEASRALCRACGFAEVGVHRRHGQLDGRWRDVLVVERLLGPATED